MLINQWRLPSVRFAAVSALISVCIMLMAYYRSGSTDGLLFLTFGVVLFGIDLLLRTLVSTRYSAMTAAAFVFVHTIGIALMLVKQTSVRKLLVILLISVLTAILAVRCLPILLRWADRSRKNFRRVLVLLTVSTLGLYGILFFFPKVNNARAWIVIGFLSIQITEITKLLFLLSLALILLSPYLTMRRQVLLSAVLLGMHLLFLALDNELGTALVLAAVWIIAQSTFLPHRYVLVLLFVVTAAFLMGLMLVNTLYEQWQGSERDDLMMTIVTKIHDRVWTMNHYQSDLAKEAIVNGGIFGASPSYILDVPVGESDYAYAMLCQRFGAVSGLLVIVAFIMVVYCQNTFLQQDRPLSRLALLGFLFTITIMTQTSIVVLTNTGLLPTVGIPLCLLSEGGSQCVLSFMMVACIVRSLDERTATPSRSRLKRKELFDDVKPKEKNPPDIRSAGWRTYFRNIFHQFERWLDRRTIVGYRTIPQSGAYHSKRPQTLHQYHRKHLRP